MAARRPRHGPSRSPPESAMRLVFAQTLPWPSGRFHLSGAGQAELFDGDLPHPELLNLARDRHREFGGKTDVAGNLVGRDLSVAELSELLGCRADAVPQADPRAHLFAVLLMRHPDHLDVADLGMRVEELFDLTRGDVLAPG